MSTGREMRIKLFCHSVVAKTVGVFQAAVSVVVGVVVSAAEMVILLLPLMLLLLLLLLLGDTLGCPFVSALGQCFQSC